MYKVNYGDVFVWEVISRERAIEIFESESREVFRLYHDDTEGLCGDEDDFSGSGDYEYGLEIDFVDNIEDIFMLRDILLQITDKFTIEQVIMMERYRLINLIKDERTIG